MYFLYLVHVRVLCVIKPVSQSVMYTKMQHIIIYGIHLIENINKVIQ